MATIYKINQGDTISKIAESQGTNVNEILKANPNIKDPNKIYAGTSINLPSSVGTAVASPASSNPEIITQARTNMAPSEFKANVSGTLSSDAFNPQNTPDVLNNNLASVDKLISGYLTPTDEVSTAKTELASVLSRKAATQLEYRNAIAEAKKNSEGAVGGGLTSSLKAIQNEYETRLADLSLQEKQYTSVLDGNKEDIGNALAIGNYYSGIDNKKVTAQNMAQDNLTKYFDSFSGSPQIQTEVESYKQSGKISEGLKPIIATGAKAGLSTAETLSMLAYQTDKVRTAKATDDYRQQQLINASEKNTKAQNFASTMAQIQGTTALLSSQGIKPGTLEYATAMANATATSQTGITAAETAGYATLANIINNVSSLNTSLKALEDTSDIKNIILNKTGASAQSLTSPQLALLTSKINQIAAPVARAIFGERGVLTEGDIQRVMSTLPSGASTSAVRNALYKEMLTNLKAGAINKLAIDASTGRNVSGVSPYVTQLVTGLDATLSSLTPTEGTTSSGVKYKIIK